MLRGIWTQYEHEQRTRSTFKVWLNLGIFSMDRLTFLGNTTDGHVVNGVARQVKIPSYWLCDVFAVPSNWEHSDILVNAVTPALSLL